MRTRCEETVTALATGGPIRRWRARWHAARCPRCAAAWDELRQLASALADTPPLAVAERRLWVAAAEDEDEVSSGPSRAWWSRPALAGALSAVVLGAVGVWWSCRPVDHRPGPPALADVELPAVREQTLRDVEGLRGDVVALAHELDDLRRRAELLDARKEVDALMARLAPRGGSSGL
jgi:hypothetical protein